MSNISNIQELEQIKNSCSAFILYFANKDCNVCNILQPKLSEAISTNLPLVKLYTIQIENAENIAAQNRIFAAPTAIVYFNGKETYRYSRNFSIDSVINEISRPYKLMFE